MEKLGLNLKFSGKITHKGKEYPFENMMDSSFLLAVMNQIDLQDLTRVTNTLSDSSKITPATTFSVLSDEPDYNMNKIYNGLGAGSITSFSCTQANLLKTTIKGSITINKSGIIKSGGFNVLQKESISPTPKVSQITRRNIINLTYSDNLINSVDWIYYKPNKALYNYTGNGIYKVPYDDETGFLGTQETLFTFGGSSSYNKIYTNFKDKIIIFNPRETSNNYMVFDLINETLTLYTIPYRYLEASYYVWDNENNVIRCLSSQYDGSGYVSGFTISLDGLLTINTGIYYFRDTPILFTKDYIWCSDLNLYHHDSTTARILGNINRHYYTSNYINTGRFLLFDDNKVMNYVIFNTNNNPSIMTVHNIKMFDSSMTILPLPSISVTQGDVVGVEYTFEIIDAR